MESLLIIAGIGALAVAKLTSDSQRETFTNAASVWAARRQFQVLALESGLGWSRVFWRYSWKHHYHCRAKLRARDGSVRDAWIICEKSFFGNPTDRIHLEYID